MSAERPPFISLVDKASRALRTDLTRRAHEAGFPELQPAHNSVFATLPPEGARAADMALRAGITRQSMGEVIRDLVRLGILEMVPDPSDGRAKIVRWTAYGTKVTDDGYARLVAVEKMLLDEFGVEDYEAARRVLARVRELFEPNGPEAP